MKENTSSPAAAASVPPVEPAKKRLTLAEVEPLLNKVFTHKGATGYTAGKQFKVITVFEHDFTGNGRVVPAVRIQRMDAPQSITLLSGRKFLERFEPVKPPTP